MKLFNKLFHVKQFVIIGQLMSVLLIKPYFTMYYVNLQFEVEVKICLL